MRTAARELAERTHNRYHAEKLRGLAFKCGCLGEVSIKNLGIVGATLLQTAALQKVAKVKPEHARILRRLAARIDERLHPEGISLFQ